MADQDRGEQPVAELNDLQWPPTDLGVEFGKFARGERLGAGDVVGLAGVAVGLQYFNAVEGANYEPTEHLLMTACVLTVVPTLIVFFMTQKYFVRGIVMSGIKG